MGKGEEWNTDTKRKEEKETPCSVEYWSPTDVP